MNALWLALHFPRFALEVFAVAGAEPTAVVAQHLVVSTNAAAESQGVHAGMRLSSALGLAPALLTREREPAREVETQYRLACWAGNFSPHVSLAGFDGPDTLLVEIAGCLRLFNGLRNLCCLIREGAEAQGFTLHMGLAPTPLAAEWLARAGQSACLRTDALRARVGEIPVEVIGLTRSERNTLKALGVKHLRELFALPASGLARRFGIGLPQRLAQALGEASDLRLPFVFPDEFAQKLELPAKVDVASMLLFAAKRLLASLCGWLSARASGVAECVLLLIHEDVSPTQLVLSFAGPTRDLERMERVLRERLANWELPEAVTDLLLEAKDAIVIAGNTPGLFAQESAQSLEPVIERLRARLGKKAVHGLAVREDHRPEYATQAVERGKGKSVLPGPSRPLWLFPQPRRLQLRDGRLLYQGAVLQRLAGPERIESGWWDHVAPEDEASEEEGGDEGAEQQKPFADVRRDYYVAMNDAGEWLWVFNDSRQWWLHGVFA